MAVYNHVKVASNSPSTNIQPPLTKLPPPVTLKELPHLPDPWLSPLPVEEAVASVKLVQKEQKHLRLLPPALATNASNPEPKLGDLLRGVDLTKLKLRQARKIAKVLGVAQKVNGRDQKLAFLVSQIKLKLQQAKVEIVEVVRQELIAC